METTHAHKAFRHRLEALKPRAAQHLLLHLQDCFYPETGCTHAACIHALPHCLEASKTRAA
jgi:hypothetical protein